LLEVVQSAYSNVIIFFAGAIQVLPPGNRRWTERSDIKFKTLNHFEVGFCMLYVIRYMIFVQPYMLCTSNLRILCIFSL
jgi:hypothetical protein